MKPSETKDESMQRAIHTAYVLMKLESDTGRGCQSRQEDGQSAVVLFAHVSGHP